MQLTLAKFILPISILLVTNDGENRQSRTAIGGMHVRQANCYCKGHLLYGKVQVVETFPDLRVEIVTSFPDLKVKVVDNSPTRCGEWKFVTEFADLKVKFVESSPDIKNKYVQSFPGLGE